LAEVFAGFVAGYALAVLSTPLLALTLIRFRTESAVLARLFPAGVSMVSLGVLVHGALFFFWTALGILLGLILLAMRDAGGALGSANAPFTLFVAGLTLALAAPFAIVLERLRQPVLLCSLLVVLVFGWLMPYLAEWSSFES
jgi:hypothetical protein